MLFWVWCTYFFTGNMNLLVLMTTLLLGNTTTKIDLKIHHRNVEKSKLPEKSWQPEFQNQWQQYKFKYKKYYKNYEEDYRRMNIFIQNSALIEYHNQLYSKGLSTYSLGHNRFSDLTHKEFVEQYLFFEKSSVDSKENMEPTVKYDPTTYDKLDDPLEPFDSNMLNDPTVRSNPTVRHDPTVRYDSTERYNPKVRHDPSRTVRHGDPTLRHNPTVRYEYEPTVRHKENDFNEKSKEWSFSNDYVDYMPPANVVLPDVVDWRRVGAVTRVKNQGKCKASWLFSTTGSLEGQIFRKTRNLTSLSEQNILDCAEEHGYKGCQNGSVFRSFQYIIRNGGINTAAEYPWYGKQSWSCHYKKYPADPVVRSIEKVPSGNELALQAAVATVGPISVGIDANSKTFKFYKHGIYNDTNCTTHNLNHNLLIVGYRQNYYVAKNSFGRDWGNYGYILLSKGIRNQCGIATRAMYPKV